MKNQIITLFLGFCLASCYKAQEPIPSSGYPRTTNEIITNDTALTIFYEACKLNEIDYLFKDTGYYTILAPINAAFRQKGFNESNISKNEELKKILLNNFIKGPIEKWGALNTMSLNKNNLPLTVYCSGTTFNGARTIFPHIKCSNGTLYVMHEIVSRLSLQDLLNRFAALRNNSPMSLGGSIFALIWDLNSNVTLFVPQLARYPDPRTMTEAEYDKVRYAHIVTTHYRRDQFFNGQIIQTVNPDVVLKVSKKNNIIKFTADDIHFSTLMEKDVRGLNGIAYDMDSSIVIK
jgi:uncharacterized surface protein with fasciclin (FAS1) repeats